MARAVVVGVVFAVLGFASIIYIPNGAKASDKNWLDSTDIKFTQIENPDPSYINPAALYGNSGNRYCTYQDIVTKPSSKNLTYFFEQQKVERRCVVETLLGATDGNLLVRGGSNAGGLLKLRSSKEFLLAGANLRTGITYDSAGLPADTAYVYFSPTLFTKIKTTINKDFTVAHEVVGDGGLTQLTNALNQPTQMRISTATYSSNANWLLFDSPYFGLVRVNTDTGEQLAFGTPTNYSQNDPRYKTAISSSGRYAIISGVSRLDIYDLATCQPQSGSLSYLQKCQVRSLEQERQTQTNGFGLAATKIRFISEQSFVYYANNGQGGPSAERLYQVSLGNVPLHNFDYLGLGDSFASGEGAFGYKLITDNSDNMCHVSLGSYPFLVGAQLNKEQYESIACSGAKTEDIEYYDSEEYEGQIPDGLKPEDRNLGEIFGNFIPGKVTQNSFAEILKPQTVTISIGGNDIGFADKLTDCILNPIHTTCFNSYEERVEAANEVASLIPTLKQTYEKLKDQNRRVYVVGYPLIIAPNGDCASNVKLNAAEVQFAVGLTMLLNDAVETAANQAGVVYVDTENIFEGKRLCETTSDQTLVHGITQGSDTGVGFLKILAKESFHPKLAAHQLYKDTILAQTNGLKKPMSSSNFETKPASLSNEDAYWMAPKTDRELFNARHTSIWDDLVKNSEAQATLDQNNTGFMPNSEVTVEIHSEPTSLGSYTTDSSGNLSLSFDVPETLEPGFHSIHVYGKDIAGQPIDVYDYFFVRATATDFDGDGVNDEDEGCVLVEPIGFDSDSDNIDDVCDPYDDPQDKKEDPEYIASPEEVVTPLPNIVNMPPSTDQESNTDTANESQESSTSQSENKPTPTNVVQNANTVATTASASNQPANGEVLSSQDEAVRVDVSPSAVEPGPFTIDQKVFEQNPKNTKVYLGYFVAGFIGFILLVGLLLIARRR